MNDKKVMLDCAANFVRIDLYQMDVLVAEIVSPAVGGSRLVGHSAKVQVFPYMLDFPGLAFCQFPAREVSVLDMRFLK
jgi:hypothetical protein